MIRKEGGAKLKGLVNYDSSSRPLVSIITVVFNRAKLIERAIQSVINQTYGNIEYIIIDGGSTDGTLEIIKQYDNAIDCWVSEPDEGMYFALNKGIALSTGTMIGIVHSDDFLLKSDTIAQMAEIAASTDYDIYHGDGLLICEHENYCDIRHTLSDDTKILETHTSILHPTSFIRRRVFDKVGLYDTRYRSASDYEFFIRCVRNNQTFYHLDFIVSGIYNCGADRVSNNCYSHLEAYRFHKCHGTGRHWHYILSYLNCRLRRTIKQLLSEKQLAALRQLRDRTRNLFTKSKIKKNEQ